MSERFLKKIKPNFPNWWPHNERVLSERKHTLKILFIAGIVIFL